MNKNSFHALAADVIRRLWGEATVTQILQNHLNPFHDDLIRGKLIASGPHVIDFALDGFVTSCIQTR